MTSRLISFGESDVRSRPVAKQYLKGIRDIFIEQDVFKEETFFKAIVIFVLKFCNRVRIFPGLPSPWLHVWFGIKTLGQIDIATHCKTNNVSRQIHFINQA